MKNFVSIKKKLAVLLSSLVIFLIIIFIFYFYPRIDKTINNLVESKTQDIVTIGYDLIEYHYNQYKNGFLDEETAKIQTLKIINNLQTDDPDSYFWIHDFNYYVITHPNEEIVGRDLEFFEDPTGFRVVYEMNKLIQEKGEGIIYYHWEKPGEEKPIPKVSYLKSFEPWEMVIGSGIYIEDVHLFRRNIIIAFFILSLLLFIFIIILVIFSHKIIIKPIEILFQISKDIVKGNSKSNKDVIFLKRNDEIGTISSSMINMVEELNNSKRELFASNEELEATNEELEASNEELGYSYTLLEQTNNELKEANEAKNVFLSRVSHELRTPMNGIIGGTHLLLNSNDIDRIKEYTQLINHSANRLLPIIDDILDISNEKGFTIELNEEVIDLNSLLSDLITSKQLLAKEKELDFIYNNNIDSFVWIKADKKRLYQIINNVISNAIEYTDEGTIEISVKIEEFLSNKLNIKFEVQDTGIGIKKENYDKIFELFEQEEKYLTRKHQGLGLGLPLTRNLIKKMNGNITFKSEEGKGTIFYFNVILDKASKPEEIIDIDFNSERKVKILAAEDDDIGIVLLKEIFDKNDYALEIANNGKEAVDLYEKKDFDIILMDLQMPQLDGIEATRIIRKREKNNKKRTPIIAVTGHVHKTDRNTCLDVGMDDFITKPYNFDEILEVVNKYVFKKE